MTGAITSFSAMAIAVRELKGAHDTFEIMAVRSAVGLLIVLAVAFATRRLGEVSAQRLGGHVLRNAIHFTGQNLWILAVTLIPLAQVFALEFTTPIWVLLLSPFFLGEHITRLRVLAAVLGFVGILVVARPDLAGANTAGANLGMAAAAASAVCFALTGITTKVLTRRESIVSIMFWLTLLQLVFGAALALWDGVVRWPTAATLPWLVLIGVTGVVAHFCLTHGYHLNIEIKPTPGIEAFTGKMVAQEAARLWQGAKVPPLLTSFKPEALAAAEQTAPLLPRGLLLDKLWADWLPTAQALTCMAVVCHYKLWDTAAVAQVHAADMKCLSYTVNDALTAQHLLALGIDGLITDRVDVFDPD